MEVSESGKKKDLSVISELIKTDNSGYILNNEENSEKNEVKLILSSDYDEQDHLTNCLDSSSLESSEGSGKITQDTFYINKSDNPDETFINPIVIKTEPVSGEEDNDQTSSVATEGENNHIYNANIQVQQGNPSTVVKDDVNNSNRPYRCDECGKYFKKSSSLKYHKKTHTGERPVSCKECGRAFTKNSDLTRHMRIHTGYRPHKCEECGKTFTQRSNLKSHLMVHSGDRPYPCYICGKNFNQKVILTEHLLTHQGDKPWKCHLCDKRYFKKNTLNRHLLAHTGVRPFKCEICDRGYMKKFDLESHMRRHTGDKPFKCDFCGRRFSQKSNMLTHFRKHPGSDLFQFDKFRPYIADEKTNVPEVISTDSLKNDEEIPHSSSVNEDDLVGEKETEEHGIKVEKISYNDAITSKFYKPRSDDQSFSIVMKHTVDSEDEELPTADEEVIMKQSELVQEMKTENEKFCESDNATHASDNHNSTDTIPVNLINDIILNSASNNTSDDSAIECHKQSVLPLTLVSDIDLPQPSIIPIDSTSSSLNCDSINPNNTEPSPFPFAPPIRGRKTTKITPYRCQDCGKYFTQRSNLTTHYKIHTGIKPWECLVCGKTFLQKNNLEIHSVVHTGVKPVSCDECGKSFSQKSSLAAHKKIHRGIKPVKCTVCGKGFTKNSDVTRHMRTHTGLKPFSCEKCDKRFAQRSNMILHMNTHLGVRQFSCELCGKSFMQKLNLKLHLKKIHGEKETPGKPFKCEICDSSFEESNELEVHVQEHLNQFNLNVSLD